MKIIYSEIKKLLPNLSVEPKILRDDLTSIGLFVSEYLETEGEIVFNLEVRQNRGDCLGYYGIARDLAVLYHIDLTLPSINSLNYGQENVPVTIKSSDVHRIQTTKISQIKNSVSPEWLQKFLRLHDINPINTMVDLTNYIMILWGIPCHAFDFAKTPNLIWENNSNYTDFVSLDGTKLKLLPDNLIISDNSKVLSLSFIGGQNSGIELHTTDAILEMAIYNRSRVRSDSRSLKTITEASIRLDKELDTETIPLAFSHLIALICTHCQAVVTGKLLDIYPQSPKPISIEFDPTKPSLYAGINIPNNFSIEILKKLGCQINNLYVIPPTIRKDLTIEEDLIEEVIRFYGYNKIPLNQPIPSDKLPDITPPILYLIEKLKDDLVAQGYDEIRSWPLVRHCEEPCDEAISTQNSINSDYPVLRQSILQSLKNQLKQYERYKLPNPKFFEIGKIFHQKNGKYIELYALGTYDGNNFSETILDNLEKPTAHIPSDQINSAIELTSQVITLDANVIIKDKTKPIELIKKYSDLIDKNILWSIEITDIFESKYTFQVCYYNCDDKTAKKIHLKTFNLTSFTSPS